jgi:hypothetical protein
LKLAPYLSAALRTAILAYKHDDQLWQLGALKGIKRGRDQFETAEVDSTSASEPRLSPHHHVEPDVQPLSRDTRERNLSVNRPAFENDSGLKSLVTDSYVDPSTVIEVVKVRRLERDSGGTTQSPGLPADDVNCWFKDGLNSVNYSQKVHD